MSIVTPTIESLSVKAFLHDKPFIQRFISFFLAHERAVLLYGGAARDLLLKGISAKPRDYDFVVDDDMMVKVEKKFAKQILGRNRFGGLQLGWKNIKIDCWPIESTWAFRQGGLKYQTWRDLAKASILNVDGVVVRISKHIEFECRPFEDARRTRTIGLCHTTTLNKTIALFRALVLGNKYEYHLGADLLSNLRHFEFSFDSALFCSLVQRRYSSEDLHSFIKYSFHEIPNYFSEVHLALRHIEITFSKTRQMELDFQADEENHP